MTFIVLDGGMGKLLEAQGAPFRQPEWSALALIEAPEEVRRAHDSFIASGAEVIITNNYAVVPFHLGEDRFRAEVSTLTALAGSIAREAAEAADHPVLVAGSIPPLFGSYEPESFNAEAAPALLAPIVGALAPHVDLFICETQSSIEEAAASLAALQDVPVPRWLSVTLADDIEAKATADECGARLRSGESVTEVATLAMANNVECLLFNCSQPEVMLSAVREAARVFKQHSAPISIGVYANIFDLEAPDADNAGPANEALHTARADMDAPTFAALAEQWSRAGASVIGGCCGIMPHHIGELTELARQAE